MNRDPLARAVLAACLTAALLAPGLLLSHSALSSPVAQNQHPEKYLPLILGRGLLAEELTATAEAAPFATATTVAATLTAAASTGTATATSTATATTTATATASPTSDPLATAQLRIINRTGFMLSYTLEGPTNASGDVNAEQVGVIAIRPGHYKIKVTTQCEFSQFEDTYATGLTYEITYSGC